MYTRQMHDDVFDEHTMPEIKRVPLEGLCLQIQLQRMSGGIAGFLGKALEPPEQDSIKSAIRTLRQIGALDEKENLTSLGQHLASLPVDVRVGKMLLYGAVLGCLGPVSDDPYATKLKYPITTRLTPITDPSTPIPPLIIGTDDRRGVGRPVPVRRAVG
jgi:hypothetical protein|tara:strand:+ start:67 stop:543 length:477 start_codon:yes stop_codon:yes gene_type:complete